MTKPTSTLICVPLTQPTPEAMVAVLEAREQPFDLAEVRLDYLREPRLEPFFEHQTCPLMFTNRATRDGGLWSGSEKERLDLLTQAESLGADYVDVERECLRELALSGRATVIGSYHNFEETPENLLEIAKGIESIECGIVKVATMAKCHGDNGRVIDVLRQIQKPAIGITMGPYGHVLRILGPKLRAFLVFASIDVGKESAPGQVPSKVIVEHYRFREITPRTQAYGLVGIHDEHIWCPVLNTVFREMEVDAVAIPLDTVQIRNVLEGYRTLPFQGFSVGRNHWKQAKRAVDDIEPGTGIVDSITYRNNGWIGYSSGVGSQEVGVDKIATKLSAQGGVWTGRRPSSEILREAFGRIGDTCLRF